MSTSNPYTVVVSVIKPTDIPDYAYWMNPITKEVQFKVPDELGWVRSLNTYDAILERAARYPNKWRITYRTIPPGETKYGIF